MLWCSWLPSLGEPLSTAVLTSCRPAVTFVQLILSISLFVNLESGVGLWWSSLCRGCRTAHLSYSVTPVIQCHTCHTVSHLSYSVTPVIQCHTCHTVSHLSYSVTYPGPYALWEVHGDLENDGMTVVYLPLGCCTTRVTASASIVRLEVVTLSWNVDLQPHSVHYWYQ